MTKQINFGEVLKNLRIKKNLTLREVCEQINYDYSNWSKVERGVLSPPNDEVALRRWAKVLGLESENKIREFIEMAQISQGIIPEAVMSKRNVMELLPAFFRTLRNAKPTKEEVDKLIELIRNS
ncbi:MAG: helix-turn-helix domain-containing protein [Patescibacteria group bacterium]